MHGLIPRDTAIQLRVHIVLSHPRRFDASDSRATSSRILRQIDVARSCVRVTHHHDDRYSAHLISLPRPRLQVIFPFVELPSLTQIPGILATKTGEISSSPALMDVVSLGSLSVLELILPRRLVTKSRFLDSWIFAICGGTTNLVIFTRSMNLYRTHNFPSTTTTDSKISTTNINLSQTNPRVVTVLPFHSENRMELNGMPASHNVLVTREWEVKIDHEVDGISDDGTEGKDSDLARY